MARHLPLFPPWFLVAVAALAHSACLGVANEDVRTSRGAICQSDAPTVGASVIRRVNSREYNNTVRDLLGDTTAPGDSFPVTGNVNGFRFDTHSALMASSPALLEQYLRTAERLSAAADLTRLLPCRLPPPDPSACAAGFIADFGAKAYRRPLEPEDAQALNGVYTRALQGGRSFEEAIRLAISAVLQSPQFLYRGEQSAWTAGSQVAPVSHYEMASRLSYFLWGSMPDAELLAAARNGQLGTADEIARQARRMLAASSSARVTVASFHAQLLQLDRLDRVMKDPNLFPNFATLRPLMKKETELFVDHVFWETDGKVNGLFESTFSFMNRPLADFYGVSGPAGDAFQRVSLNPSQRSGLLTQASFLATKSQPDRTSPTLRGKFVREQLLCQALAPPPNDVPPLPTPPTPTTTMRERMAQHAVGSCAGCHRLTDSIGFGFENYDAIGAYRTTENGVPVDASGELTEARDATGPFVGAVSLSGKLAKSRIVRDCVVLQWFRFAHGRSETADDACALETIQTRFVDSGGDMRELLIAIAQADSFRYLRRESPGEGP